MKKLIASLAATALLGACGGSQPQAESAPPAASAAPAGSEAAPAAFHDMNRDQRMAFMKETVLPTMKPLFQKFDAKRFAEFNCGTCHGAGAKDGSFKMPNPDLPKLPGSPDGFKALMEKSPDIMSFMGKEVKPTMASLLHEEPFNPQTGKGFGCMECHTTGS